MAEISKQATAAAKLAVTNLKKEMARVNRISDPTRIEVRIKDSDGLCKIAASAMASPATAHDYDKAAAKRILVSSGVFGLKTSAAGHVFVESILSTLRCRTAHRRLALLKSGERWFNMARDIDRGSDVRETIAARANLGENIGSTVKPYALNAAKDHARLAFGTGFLKSFDFDDGPVRINHKVKQQLEQQAYNPDFSVYTREMTDALALNTYQKSFAPRVGVFSVKIKDTEPAPAEKKPVIKPAPLPTPKKQLRSMDFPAIYGREFADLPTKGAKRHFINLKACVNDVFICRKESLYSKRQFAEIEFASKHNYIMDYYDDNMPEEYNAPGRKQDYYMLCENEMYKRIWHRKDGIKFKNDGRIYFPDGFVMRISKDEDPHVFMHRVNAAYAAMFGCLDSDVQGGEAWMLDTVRRAYTDEGLAEYRLVVINARLERE